jgi:hypothetical protein
MCRFSDQTLTLGDVRFEEEPGRHLLTLSSSQFDPSRRLTAAQQWSRFQGEADSSINCIALHGKVNGADM